MKMQLLDNKLYCLFRTSNSLLHVQYIMKPKEESLYYEISSYAEKEPTKTAHDKNARLEVESYRLLSVQSSMLKRDDALPSGATKK